MKLINLILLTLFFSHSIFAEKGTPEPGSSVEKNKKLTWTFTPDPKLPNVLILGDSISIAYTLKVRERLKGIANVYRPSNGNRPSNCNGTLLGVVRLNKWLKMADKWDVIHFNWGLHDLKHVKKAGTHEKSNDPNDPTQATLEVYKKNMESIVAQLKETQAKLIFATTTPVVPGTLNPLRTPEAPVRYNAAATEIMKANDIQINDLHAYCLPNLKEWQKTKNVHFHTRGSEALADKVSSVIKKELESLSKQ